jgi:hypothetical protein
MPHCGMTAVPLDDLRSQGISCWYALVVYGMMAIPNVQH